MTGSPILSSFLLMSSTAMNPTRRKPPCCPLLIQSGMTSSGSIHKTSKPCVRHLLLAICCCIVPAEHQCRQFIIILAKASILFGTCTRLRTNYWRPPASSTSLPNPCSSTPRSLRFRRQRTVNERTHFVQQGQGLDLGRLRESDLSYIHVTRDEVSTAEGTAKMYKQATAH